MVSDWSLVYHSFTAKNVNDFRWLVSDQTVVWLIQKLISILMWTFSNMWKYICQIAWSVLFQIDSKAVASCKCGSASPKTSLYYFPVKLAIWYGGLCLCRFKQINSPLLPSKNSLFHFYILLRFLLQYLQCWITFLGIYIPEMGYICACNRKRY